MTNLGERIVVLIDMDCFFCQVEAKLKPALKGKPLAVIQYGSFGPSSIIAVNYEARAYGVTRHMKGNEAKEKCPDIVLVTVPPIRNKPDTGRYRIAGKQVIDVLKKYCSIIERASIDEAYLDITDLVDQRMNSGQETSNEDMMAHLANTFVVGYCDEDNNDEEIRKKGVEKWLNESFDDLGDSQARRLAIAGMIVEEFRAQIWSQCEYRCSAGISYNKILAKLACGLHKPNRQTILPTAAVPGLYSTLPVKKVRNLGGKFGNIVMESLGCNVMADLLKYSLQDLQRRFDEKTGSWLYNIARGIDNEPVTNRLICKSIGSSKNFPGKAAITKLEDLKRWIGELVEEIVDRLEQDLEENQRRATHLTISYHSYQDRKVISQSKSCSLPSYKVDRIANMCIDVITKATQKPITFIGMSAGKFIPVKNSGHFVNFFKTAVKPEEPQTKKQQHSANGMMNYEQENIVKHEQSSDNNDEENDDFHVNVNFDNSKMKTYQRKSIEAKSENRHSLTNFLLPQETTSEKQISLPAENEQKSPASMDRNSTKMLDEGNFKNSFFMNFLKDSRPSSTSSTHVEQIPDCGQVEKPLNFEFIDTNSSDKCEIESPDLFEDCEVEKRYTNEESKFEELKNNDGANKGENNALAQLKEIFPDLDNIDSSVLQLLPVELQREANTYMKSQSSSISTSDKNNVKIITKSKSTKGKSIVAKVPNNNGVMKNFLINNSTSSSSSSPKKQCSECNQMVAVKKFQEHCDFHIAQNLQRLINQNTNEGENISRTSEQVITTETLASKRKLSIESPKPNKKARSIASFFTS